MKTRLVLVIGIFVLSACQSNNYLYIQETVAGVDLGVSANGNNRLSVGYTADTFAIIPQKEDEGEAASSLAIINGEIKGLDCFKYQQFNATGKAAKNLATKPDVLSQARKKIYTEGQQDLSSECK